MKTSENIKVNTFERVDALAKSKGVHLVKAHVHNGVEYLVDHGSECLFQGTLDAAARFIENHQVFEERLAA